MRLNKIFLLFITAACTFVIALSAVRIISYHGTASVSAPSNHPEPAQGSVRENNLKDNPLKFAVISDIHDNLPQLQKALEKSKADGMQFAIITGDLTNEGTKEELNTVKNVLDESKLPYFAVPGNHDTWASHKTKGNYFQDIFGSEFTSFEKCGSRINPCPSGQITKFILLSNADYLKGYAKVQNPTYGSQKNWLINEIKNCPQISCLVFMHMPLSHPTSGHLMGENDKIMTLEAKELEQLLAENQVREVFAGHIHLPAEYDSSGLHTTIIGALGLYSHKFHFLELNGGNNQRQKNFLTLPI